MRSCAGVLILEPILGLAAQEPSDIIPVVDASEPRAHFLRWVEKVRGTGYICHRRFPSSPCSPGPGKHGMSPLHSQRLFKNTLPSGKHWYLCFPEGSSLSPVDT